ncbi:MAG: hypothetical protein P4L82_12585 [Ancalomicrobiaceae bacterium]|nr:hypothetical protein [Ancalomicrobiaceae bacterium]
MPERRQRNRQLPAVHAGVVALMAAFLAAPAAAAGPADCARMKQPLQSLRLTLFTLNTINPLMSQDRLSALDVDRAGASEVVLVNHLKSMTMKSVMMKNGLPLLVSIPERDVETRYEYDTDVAQYRFAPGASFSFTARMIPRKGDVGIMQNDYSVTGPEKFTVAGCTFDVLAVHHVIHSKQGTVERDTIVDSLYAPELSVILRTHIRTVGVGNEQVMLVTDIGLAISQPAPR